MTQKQLNRFEEELHKVITLLTFSFNDIVMNCRTFLGLLSTIAYLTEKEN